MNTDRFKFRVWDNGLKEYEDDCCVCQDGRLAYYATALILEYATIEQCTGLKDRNGKLIYEGDKCKDTIGDVWNIIWNPIRCQFKAAKGSSYYLMDSREVDPSLEIIGNIHEVNNDKL